MSLFRSAPGRLTFGEAVRFLRRMEKISGRELARRAHLSPAGLYRLERGFHQPKPQTVLRLARALRVDPAELKVRVVCSRCRQAIA